MNGRVLSEQTIRQLEEYIDNEMVQDLIATLRDREKPISQVWDSLQEIARQRDIAYDALSQIAKMPSGNGPAIPIARKAVKQINNSLM